MTPKVSIIVPVYKVGEYLDQCVQSVLQQTLKDWELILVDDGSPDGCGKMCDGWAEKDSRIHTIHKQNGGLRSAVLAGLQQAAGAYTGFIDGDDWAGAEMFETLYAAAEKYGVDLAECGYIRTQNGPDELYCSDAEEILDEQTLREKVIPEFFDGTGKLPYFTAWARWNKLYRTATLRQAMEGCRADLQMGEDCSQLAAFLPLCRKAVVLKGACLYYYRRSSISMTLDYSRYTPARYDAFISDCIATAKKYGYEGGGFARQKDRLLTLDLLGLLSSTLPVEAKKKKIADTLAHIADRRMIRTPDSPQGPLGKCCLWLFSAGCVAPVVVLGDWYARMKK